MTTRRNKVSSLAKVIDLSETRLSYGGPRRSCVRCGRCTSAMKPYCLACLSWTPYVQEILAREAKKKKRRKR